jgi:hypothetical protein
LIRYFLIAVISMAFGATAQACYCQIPRFDSNKLAICVVIVIVFVVGVLRLLYNGQTSENASRKERIKRDHIDPINSDLELLTQIAAELEKMDVKLSFFDLGGLQARKESLFKLLRRKSAKTESSADQFKSELEQLKMKLYLASRSARRHYGTAGWLLLVTLLEPEAFVLKLRQRALERQNN